MEDLEGLKDTIASPSNATKAELPEKQEKPKKEATSEEKKALKKRLRELNNEIDTLEADQLKYEIELLEFKEEVERLYMVGIPIEDRLEAIDEDIAALKEQIENKDIPPAEIDNIASIDDMEDVVEIEEDTIILPTPVKTGFRFLYWSDTEDGSGNQYASGETFQIEDEEVALYAIWEDDEDFYKLHEEKELEQLQTKLDILEEERKKLVRESKRDTDDEDKLSRLEREYEETLSMLEALRDERDAILEELEDLYGEAYLDDDSDEESTDAETSVPEQPVAELETKEGSENGSIVPVDTEGTNLADTVEDTESVDTDNQASDISENIESDESPPNTEEEVAAQNIVEDDESSVQVQDMETKEAVTEGSIIEDSTTDESVADESVADENTTGKSAAEGITTEESTIGDTVSEEGTDFIGGN